MEFDPKKYLFEKFKKEINSCQKCLLYKERKNIVFGEGGVDRQFMIVGEAPGESEDEQGAPFVGKAGKILDEVLRASNVKRDLFYITNSILCRPPDNRNPLFEEEIQKCLPRLLSQIYFIRPKLIVAMGAVATQTLIPDFKTPLKDYVGKITYGKLGNKEYPIFVTYHPSFLLRQRSMISVAKEHWLQIKGIINYFNGKQCDHLITL